MSTSIFADDDSADDLFTQQPKKSSKKGSKKDAIESVFDNDSDDFLDTISKGSTSSDTGGDKNGPSGPPDNTPVDMTTLTYEERSELRKLKRKTGKDPTWGDLRKIQQTLPKKSAPATITSKSKDEPDAYTNRSTKKKSTSSITVSVSSKSSKEPEPLKNKIAAFESKTAGSATAGSKTSPKITTTRATKVKPAATAEVPTTDSTEQQQRVKTLEKENEELKTKNNELSDKLIASQDASKKKMEDLKQEISKLQEERDEFEQKMDEFIEKTEKHEVSTPDKESSTQQASTEEIEDLKQQVSKMKDKQGEYQQQIEALEVKNKKLKTALGSKTVDHESQYEAQVKEQEFEEKIEDFLKVIEALREESNHLKTESAHFKEESEKMHKDAQHKDEEYEKKMEELQKVIVELKKESTHLKEESALLHKEREHLQESHKADLDELNGQVNELSVENADLKEEISVLKESLQSGDGEAATASMSNDLHKEVAELYSKVHQLEQDARDHDEAVADYQEQISSLKKENQAYQDKVSLLERENKALKGDIASLSAQASDQAASGDIEALRKKLKEVEEDRKRKEEDCVAMVEELDDKDREIDELKKQLANAGSGNRLRVSRSPAPVEQPVAEPPSFVKSHSVGAVAEQIGKFSQQDSSSYRGPLARSKSSTPQPQAQQPQQPSDTVVEKEIMESPQTIVEDESIRRQASEQEEEEDGYVRTRKLTSFWEQKASSKAKSTTDIKPPSTKLSSPMPEAENTSWTQSTIPAVEIREEKVIDSDVQDDKRDEISEEAVEAEDALGENTGIVHKRLQKMVSSATVSDNKPPEKKPLSAQTSWAPPKGDSCAVCNLRVYVVEKLEADKIIYHKRCFRCNKCKKVLSTGTYAALEGVIYCKPHFKQLFREKGNYDEGFGREQHKTKWLNKQ